MTTASKTRKGKGADALDLSPTWPKSGPWANMNRNLLAKPALPGEGSVLDNGLHGVGFLTGQSLRHESGGARMIFNSGNPTNDLNHALRFHGESGSTILGQLTDIETDVVGELYKPKDGLLLCPTMDNLDWGAQYTQYHQVSGGGKAKIVNGIDPVVSEVAVGVKPIRDDVFTALVGYPIQYGLRQGNALGIDYDYVREQDGLCSEALWEIIDTSMLNLDSTGGVRGFLADKEGRVGNYTLPGAGGGEYLKDTSGTEVVLSTASATVLADALIKLIADVRLLSGKTVMANRLAVPDRLLTLIERTRHGSGTDTTILQYVYSNSDLRKSGVSMDDAFVSVTDFQGLVAAKGNQSARDIICAYRHDPNIVSARIMSPRRFKIVEKTLGEMVIWAARFTPAQWKRPLGIQIRSAKWS